MAEHTEMDIMQLASDILEVRAQLKILNATREIMDFTGNIYGTAMQTLDTMERAADEDVNQVADIIDKRHKLKESEKHIDEMVKSVKEMEDTILPKAEAILDKIIKYAGIVE